ncbi:response regulator [Oligoflexus tunisiensis]|uniref:response regulator n=1 Tax=Oligoflexus tunisiensis TaxID=708132 RepID=UPI00114CAEE4|nr:response regulator [Oligoflexus tunisiensis]
MNQSVQKTILVVDDEIDLCEILQFDLEDSGYRVYTACRAADALDILQKQTIDLIVSDIRMPGGDGVHLLHEVRKKHFEQPPVIFVSGFADVTIAEAFHQGVVGFITKPLSFETLLHAIQFHLKDPEERWSDSAGPLPQKRYERAFASLSHAEIEASALLGRGGIFLRMDEELPRLDEVVRVNVQLQKEGVQLEGWAACRWIRNANGRKQPRGAGLEWMKLTPAAVRFIRSITQEEKRLPYIPME